MSKLPKSTLTISFLLACLVGVAMGEFFLIETVWLVGFAAVGLLVLLFGKRFFQLSGILILGITLGWLRFQFSLPETTSATLDFYNDHAEKVELIGVIAAEPDRRADHAKYVIEVSTRDSQKVTGKILIKTALLPEYFYGDELKIRGKIETPFETEEFSYRDYLARFGIRSVAYFARIEKISSGNKNFFFTKLFAFKQKFEAKINQIFPEPAASFEAGLLIGSRRGIPPKVLEDFNTTGLTHIIAISGYNISILIALITALFGNYISRRWQFPLAVIFIVAFTLLVGAGAAVTRAAVMGLLAFYALTHGRQYHVGLAITLTATAMVFWNPQILLHDVSFQLSFAAVAGLLFVSPLLEEYFQKIPNKFAIRESLLLTISAQITAVPLIVFYFDRLSLISPLANVLVAPAIPLAMLTGFIAVVVGAIYLPAGLLVGFVTYGILNYILFIAEWGAKLPGASVEVGWFGMGFAVVYYLALIGFLLWRESVSLKNEA
jgi:competence protein ComEC